MPDYATAQKDQAVMDPNQGMGSYAMQPGFQQPFARPRPAQATVAPPTLDPIAAALRAGTLEIYTAAEAGTRQERGRSRLPPESRSPGERAKG